MNYSSAQLTVFRAAFARSPPSSPVDASGLRFTAPRTQRVLVEAVGVFERVLVLGPQRQYGVIDDRLPTVVMVVMDVARTSVQLERQL